MTKCRLVAPKVVGCYMTISDIGECMFVGRQEEISQLEGLWDKRIASLENQRLLNSLPIEPLIIRK